MTGNGFMRDCDLCGKEFQLDSHRTTESIVADSRWSQKALEHLDEQALSDAAAILSETVDGVRSQVTKPRAPAMSYGKFGPADCY